MTRPPRPIRGTLASMLLALALACTPPPVVVTLDGPAEVRVVDLGPIALPGVRVARGDDPIAADGLAWSADPAAVATIDGANLIAVGPGTATVTAAVGDAKASFALIVDPPVAVTFDDPPSRLLVGQTVGLSVRGHVGAVVLPVGTITWSSSNDAVATVSPTGQALGISPGRAYLTAVTEDGEAILELDVLAAP